MRTLRAIWLGMLGLVLGVGLVGISTVPSSAATSGTFKIGLLGDFHGALASNTIPVPGAFEAWAKSVNAHGGINGQKVDVIVKDDFSNPTTSSSEAHQLIEEDHVQAIADESGVDTAWAGYVEQQKVPVIGIAISNIPENTNPDFFPEGQTEDSVETAAIYAAKKAGGTKLAVMYCAEIPECGEGASVLKQIGPSLGVPVVYTSAISFDAPSYAAQCLAARQAGANVMWIADAVGVFLSAGADCAKQGYTPIQIGDDGGVTLAALSNPAFADHLISVQPDIPFSVKSTAATKTMYAALKKYDPSGLEPTNLGEIIVEAWTAGVLIQKAATLGGANTSAKLISGLYKIHHDTLDGLSPPLTFAKGKGHTINCWYFLSTKNGKFVPPSLVPVCHPDLK